MVNILEIFERVVKILEWYVVMQIAKNVFKKFPRDKWDYLNGVDW